MALKNLPEKKYTLRIQDDLLNAAVTHEYRFDPHDDDNNNNNKNIGRRVARAANLKKLLFNQYQNSRLVDFAHLKLPANK